MAVAANLSTGVVDLFRSSGLAGRLGSVARKASLMRRESLLRHSVVAPHGG